MAKEKNEPAAGMPGGKATPEAEEAEAMEEIQNERLRKIIEKNKEKEGKAYGGKVKKMAYGGKVKKMAYGGKAMKMGHGGKVSKSKKSSCRGDGIAQRGRTKGRMV